MIFLSLCIQIVDFLLVKTFVCESLFLLLIYHAGVNDSFVVSQFVPEDKRDLIAKVGAWVIMHRDDMEKVAPLWLEYTKKVHQENFLLNSLYLSYKADCCFISLILSLLFVDNDDRLYNFPFRFYSCIYQWSLFIEMTTLN